MSMLTQLVKSQEVITLPVLIKDEKKYSDCVDILDQLEEWTHMIYEASGLYSRDMQSSSTHSPIAGHRSNPDEPRAH